MPLPLSVWRRISISLKVKVYYHQHHNVHVHNSTGEFMLEGPKNKKIRIKNGTRPRFIAAKASYYSMLFKNVCMMFFFPCCIKRKHQGWWGALTVGSVGSGGFKGELWELEPPPPIPRQQHSCPQLYK